jgi:hypothetical protein
MGTDVVEHGDEIGLERHGVALDAELHRFGAFMGQVIGDDRPLEELVSRHVVFNQQAQIDDAPCHFDLRGSRFHPAGMPDTGLPII